MPTQFISSRTFVACTAALFVSASRPQESGTLKIAYNVLYDKSTDNYEIFIMNLDGTGKRNISNWKGVDWVYTSYEDRLYFVSDRDTSHRMYFLYEMDADGNNIRRICPFRLEDSWLGSRKGGTEFVVSGRKDGFRNTLYIIDINGNILRQLTSDTSQYYNDPCFSPDGKQVVFRHKTNRRDRNENDELWMMDDDGTNQRRITHYPQDDPTRRWDSYKAGPPQWRPGTNIISYNSWQKGNYSIFSIHSDGSGGKQLTNNDMNEGWHSWSPNGSLIAFDGSDLEDSNYSIYIMNADGSGMRQLTDEYKYEQAPVFVRSFSK